MKIDMQLIRDLVAANAPASAILAYLEREDALQKPKREKKKIQKRAERATGRRQISDTVATSGDRVATEAEIVETPRARLFRESKAILLTLGVSKTRAGALITEWLKLTGDNEQLIADTIQQAQKMAVNEAPGWILAQLRGKTNGRQKSSLSELAFDLSGEAAELERQAGISR